jgi:hypothetical protein
VPGYEFHTVIRGTPFWGYDFDGLAPADRDAATAAGLSLSQGGHGLMGMRCHRDAKQQYLAVTSKRDYWSVPVTEVVTETYLCPEYQRRVPGTGYRG